MRRFASIAAVVITLTSPARGQVNIEELRSESGDSGLVGAVGMDLSLRTGNVDLVELDIDARADHLTSASSTLFLINADVGFLSGNRFANDGLLHLRHGRAASRIVTIEGFGQLNYDKARLLDFRALVGGGVRLTVTDTQRVGLWLGVGWMFEHEVLGLAPDAVHARETNDQRSSNYVVIRMVPAPHIVFASTSYVQSKVGELGDVRMLNESGLGVVISGTVSLRVKFNLRYDSRPPDGIAGLDTQLTNGVAIRF